MPTAMQPVLSRITIACGIFATLFASAMASVWPYDCPTHIDAFVPGYWSPDDEKPDPRQPPLHSMQQVHNALTNCTDVKSLKLRVTMLGCSNEPDRYNFPFQFPRGSHFPSQLKVLHLDGYEFDERVWMKVQPPTELFPYYPHSWFPDGIEDYLRWYFSDRATKYYEWRDLPDDQRNRTNLDLWIDAMDFSHIQELGLRDIRGAEVAVIRLPPLLKSLKTLSIRDHSAEDFILALPPNSLEHLSWVSGCHCMAGESTLDAVLYHGKSLLSLERREPESSYHRRAVLSAEQLAWLGDKAPNLQNLTIDLNRNGTWPMEELEAIAMHFSNLSKLTIYLELASEQRRQLESAKLLPDYSSANDEIKSNDLDNMARPLLNKTAGAELFQFLRQKKVGKELTEVRFFAGDWERFDDGPLSEPSWLENRNEWVTCKVLDDWIEGSSERQFVCNGTDTTVIFSERAWIDSEFLYSQPEVVKVSRARYASDIDEEEEEQIRQLQREIEM